MAATELVIPFPINGLDRSGAYDAQPPLTTPLALNVWCLDPATNRHRGGNRPVLVSLSTTSAPYHWAPVAYVDTSATPDTVREAIMVCNANGVYSTLDGATWTERIAQNPASNFATCAYYNGKVYMASAGDVSAATKVKEAAIPSGSDADLSNAGGGTAPINCGLVWVHQDRLALAGCIDSPHQIFMSAVGDATDWDYSDTTSGGAWTNTGSEGGIVGHRVVAAIDHGNGISLIGSPRSIYAVVGNPRVGGTRRVSHSIGPLMQNAWCKGIDANGQNATYMMTYDGLYVLGAGSTAEPQKVSRRKIPGELIGINPGAGDRVAIGYDSQWPGIHIAVDVGGDQGSDTINYFYHIPTDSYWPMSLPITPWLFPTFPALQTATRSAILPIGHAGDVRQYDNTKTPGGVIGGGPSTYETFDSYVWIGPIPLGSPGGEGILRSISAALAKDSQNADWQIYVGDAAEEAFNSTAAFSGTAWSYTSGQHWNYTQHPRVRGNVAYLKVYDSNNRRWLIEQIVATVVEAGRRRVG